MALLPTLPAPNTPSAAARQRAYGEQMLGTGLDYSPVGHWLQGAARLSNAYFGGRAIKSANEAEQSGLESAAAQREALIMAMLGQGAAASPALPPIETPTAATPPDPWDMTPTTFGAAAIPEPLPSPTPPAASPTSGTDALIEAMMSLGRNPWASQGDSALVNAVIGQRMAAMQSREPIEINGRLVDPVTYEVLADFSDQAAPSVGPPDTQEFWNADLGVMERRGWNPVTQQYDIVFGQTEAPSATATAAPEVMNGIGENGETIQLVFAPDHENANEFGFVQMGGAKLPEGLTVTLADGTVISQGGAAARPPTESNLTSNIYASRMAADHDILTQFEGAGTEFWAPKLRNIPWIGNALVSPEYRQFEQAERDWINASLRRESGAVISEEEFANARLQYIPQPFDDPATLAQKRAARELQQQMIAQAAGSAYSPPVEEAPTDAPSGWTPADGGGQYRVVP